MGYCEDNIPYCIMFDENKESSSNALTKKKKLHSFKKISCDKNWYSSNLQKTLDIDELIISIRYKS